MPTTEPMLAHAPAPKQAPAVYALIPAYGRPELLERALASLADQAPALRGVIVVNNSGDHAIARVAAAARVPTVVLAPGCNLGTAGGIAVGLHAFLQNASATHVWILDDDAVATPHALDEMLAGLTAAVADAAAPLITDDKNQVRWVPCLLGNKFRRFLRRGPTPQEFLHECGEALRPWSWTIWASVLISRRAVAAAGFPELELWSQFSDIEYTLRVTERFTAVLAPRAVCRHLPPPASGPAFDAKLYSALQNAGYVTTRFRHGWRALRHLPGQNFRYLRHYHWRPRAWWELATAFFQGAVLGRPTGRTVHAAEVARVAPLMPQRA